MTLKLLVVPEMKHTHTHIHIYTHINTHTESNGDASRRHRSQLQELPMVNAGTSYMMQEIHVLPPPPQPLLYESLSATLFFTKDIDQYQVRRLPWWLRR